MRFVKFVLVMFVLLTAAIGYLFFMGNPRMRVQPLIKPYQAQMPLPPEGSVSIEPAYEPLPTTRQTEKLVNPLAATPENIAAGRTYYGYYCQACHGENADGQGPVGESYLPVPINLRSARVPGMSDGQLLRGMLTGPGHSPLRADPQEQRPVLEYVVLPEYRWYLVLYVRSLKD